ncbi:MAG: haloacid dehalogenase-like hydrolase [Clostridiales bacterium]|nr:haloacid dehalogenase-like hydrolase [Clostridiales bacterium]
MDDQTKQLRTWRAISAVMAVIALAAIIGIVVITFRNIIPAGNNGNEVEVTVSYVETSEESAITTVPSEETSATTETSAEITETVAADSLSLWTENAPAKKALITYMETVTDEGSADFIPVENRIAVFDMDGTILCETDPYYFDHMILVYRVLEDPEYKNKASDFEKDVANRLQAKFDGDKSVEVSMVEHGQAVASAFAGMTVEEFEDYVKEFAKQPAPGYNGMTRGEAFYKPMLQIIDYLQANDFKVYIVSGTDRLIVRGLIQDVIDIPRNQLIGSDETLVASNQGNEDGETYTFTDKDKLVTGGDFIIKNLNTNKVTVIMQEIGIQPVLSFGNSTGDAAMAEFTTTDNKYKSLAFMLCCDDLERENGNADKADKMVKLCDEYGWVAVSMKNDWTTIYGEGVTRKK